MKFHCDIVIAELIIWVTGKGVTQAEVACNISNLRNDTYTICCIVDIIVIKKTLVFLCNKLGRERVT